VEHNALQILDEALGVALGQLVRVDGGGPELGLAFGQPVGLKLCRPALGIVTDEHEVAVVGDEDLAIPFEVSADLFAFCNGQHFVAGSFDLYCAAGRNLTRKGLRFRGFLELIRREETSVRDACALILDVDDTADAGLERLAQIIQ
jgi:hypothetical protein